MGPLQFFLRNRNPPPPHLRTETDPVSEMLSSLVPRIPDDGQSKKPSNSKCYTPVSRTLQNLEDPPLLRARLLLPLPSNDYCIVAYFAVVAQHRARESHYKSFSDISHQWYC
jgi:hypothetical protein